MIPYVSSGFEWCLGDVKKSIHKPLYNCTHELDEPVVKFIRRSRSYCSVWTSAGNLYEIRNNDGTKEKMNLKSSVPPTYANGWYVGYAGGHLNFVNRLKPSTMVSIKYTGRRVTDLVYLPYTRWLIVNTVQGCRRCAIDTSGDVSIDERLDLGDSYSKLAKEEIDSAVLALAHDGGNITIIWTSSWKTHHTVACSTVRCLAINAKYLVAVMETTHGIQVWNTVSGDLVTVASNIWHRPTQIVINDQLEELGMVTVDPDHDVLAMWCVNRRNVVDWKVKEINSSVDLIFTMPLCISSARTLTPDGLYLFSGHTVKRVKISLSDTMFTWQRKWKQWIRRPSVQIALDFYSSSLVELMKPVILDTIDVWTTSLFDNVTDKNVKECNHILFIFLKDPDISARFKDIAHAYVVKTYDMDRFKDRETCRGLLDYMTTFGAEVTVIFNTFGTPTTRSDFIFWLTVASFAPSAVSSDIQEEVWQRGGTSAMEFLYATQDKIANWKPFLDKQVVFQFVTPHHVVRSCELGHVNDWLALFDKIRSMDCPYRHNVEACWKELVTYILDVERIRTFTFPNNSDGRWERKNVSEIKNDAWVMVNESIQRSGTLGLDGLVDIKIPVWVPTGQAPKMSRIKVSTYQFSYSG
jgi:hypothetical protein